MNNKIILLALMFFLFISPVLALENFGTFKQNTNVRLTQTCSNATWINISSVTVPDSKVGVSNVSMIYSNNGEYYYNYNVTQQIGTYNVNGISDGCQNDFSYNFEVSPSGFVNTLGFYLTILIAIALVIILGFKMEDAWFIVVGGMMLMIFGIYSINSGVAGFRDMFMTWAIGLFEIGVGFMLCMNATEEMIR